MRQLLQHAKPNRREIQDLALRETDPGRAGQFAPIARGPLLAVLALALVLLAALPFCLLRILRGVMSRNVGGEPT